jgi:hypothetical protein
LTPNHVVVVNERNKPIRIIRIVPEKNSEKVEGSVPPSKCDDLIS